MKPKLVARILRWLLLATHLVKVLMGPAVLRITLNSSNAADYSLCFGLPLFPIPCSQQCCLTPPRSAGTKVVFTPSVRMVLCHKREKPAPSQESENDAGRNGQMNTASLAHPHIGSKNKTRPCSRRAIGIESGKGDVLPDAALRYQRQPCDSAVAASSLSILSRSYYATGK